MQGIRADSSDVLAGFVSQLNAEGPHYEYILGPRVGPAGRQQQFAFLFNAERISADREAAYVVEDPDDLLTYEPLSAPFSARQADGPSVTWTAINVLVDGAALDRELPALAQRVPRGARRRPAGGRYCHARRFSRRRRASAHGASDSLCRLRHHAA